MHVDVARRIENGLTRFVFRRHRWWHEGACYDGTGSSEEDILRSITYRKKGASLLRLVPKALYRRCVFYERGSAKDHDLNLHYCGGEPPPPLLNDVVRRLTVGNKRKDDMCGKLDSAGRGAGRPSATGAGAVGDAIRWGWMVGSRSMRAR